MRKSWTDERLDDLNHRVDNGFNRVEADVRALRSEVKDEFKSLRGEMRGEFRSVREEMKDQGAEIYGRLDTMNSRFDSLQRTLIAGMFATLLGLIATQL